MASADSTCWSEIQKAADGDIEARDGFARQYEPVVRAYLAARWKGTTRIGMIDDAVQEVFLDCFRTNGALSRVNSDRPGGFRAFLHGVVRIVALRHESGRARKREHPAGSDFDVPGDEPGLSSVFDRAWALSILEQAVLRHRDRAQSKGEVGMRRVELLRLRFQEDLPVREIARAWDWEPAKVHKEYARARADFRVILLEVISFHHPGSRAELEAECSRLLALF